MNHRDWNDEDERPTSRGGKRPPSDVDRTVGQLLVESLHHRKRLETLEALVENAGLTPDSLPPIGRRRSLPELIRKTVTTTVLIIAAVLSALRELGFLGVH